MRYSNYCLAPSALRLHVIIIICKCKRCTVHCLKPVEGAVMFTMCGMVWLWSWQLKMLCPKCRPTYLSPVGVVALPPGWRGWTPSLLFHNKTVCVEIKSFLRLICTFLNLNYVYVIIKHILHSSRWLENFTLTMYWWAGFLDPLISDLF
jgi:hypothetical protein